MVDHVVSLFSGSRSKMHSPFIFSDDNKRYHTYNYYLRHRFSVKTCKVPLDAGFTCPNRDGKCGTGGCIFCSGSGSGEFTQPEKTDLIEQFNSVRQIMTNKWPDALPVPYLQSFTNTYGPLNRIKECIEPFMHMEEVPAIAIATRADCLEDEVIAYLDECAKTKDIWLELGLQSSNDDTARLINRGHDFACFKETVERLSHTKVMVCVHIINGLPYETEEMMLDTIRSIADMPIKGVKIHMLSVLKGTKLAELYEKEPFHILTKEEYVDICVKQLELLPAHIVVQRMTGDPLKEDLVAPSWVLNKTDVLNSIDKQMKKLNVYQGDKYMNKPLIGVTPRINKVYTNQVQYTNNDYFKAIELAGGIPVLLPLHFEQKLVDTLDGLMVTGGEDVDPSSYHAERDLLCQETDIELDLSDKAYIEAFNHANKPILGICRGHQMINVVFGGTLIQDIPSKFGTEHNQRKLELTDLVHKVDIDKDSALSMIMKDIDMVNTYHHQCVDKVADGFKVTAVSEEGIIEAIEKEDILCVQWHPERLTHYQAHLNIFVWLVNKCIERKING